MLMTQGYDIEETMHRTMVGRFVSVVYSTETFGLVLLA
jgi:hypothetical protein